MQASNLSLVKGWYLSNISINIESNNVPAIDFIKNSFPTLKILILTMEYLILA